MTKYLLLIAFGLVGCDRYSETTDGRKYRATVKCVESHSEKETGYHWGVFFGPYMNYEGKLTVGLHTGFHWEYQCLSACTKTVCDKSINDTTWIN